MIDNNYDLTLRLVVDVTAGHECYDAGGKDLHLIGMGMDNGAADRCYNDSLYTDYADFWNRIGMPLGTT